MTQPEVVDTTSFSASFPKNPAPYIRRDYLIDALAGAFSSEIDLVALQGAEGTGKTLLLALFAKSKGPAAFSVFVNESSRWTHDPELVGQDIYAQLHWFLYGQPVPADFLFSEGKLRKAYLDASRKGRSEGHPVYLVLDGFTELADDRAEVLIDVLPAGFPGFQYLVSGDAHRFEALARSNKRVAVIALPFTPPETADYLSDSGLAKKDHDSIWNLTKGVPGFVASIRRSLLGGVSVETLLKENPKDLDDALAHEWNRLKASITPFRRTLALLAFDSRRHSLASLNKLSNEELAPDQIDGLRSVLTFDRSTMSLEYVNEATRRFAAKRLADLRTDAIDSIIKDLLSAPDSRDALTLLPGYLHSARDFATLLEVLSPEYFDRVVEITQSIGSLRSSVSVGIEAAQQTDRLDDLLRFTIHAASLRTIEGSAVPLSAIRAYIALNEDDKAVEIAQSARLQEERLHALAVVATQQLRQRQGVDPTLVDSIRKLYAQIRPQDLGARAIDIASDMMLVVPDLALDLMSRVDESQYEGPALDAAFAHLSIVAMGGIEVNEKLRDSAQAAHSRIKDSRTKQLSAAVAGIVKEQAAAEVLAYASQVENPSDRLTVLRLWLEENQGKADSVRIVEEALSLAIRTTEYSVSAASLRPIAHALEHVPLDSLPRLIALFDTQVPTAAKLGPTEEYIRLLLLLATAEARLEPTRGLERFKSAYAHAAAIADLAVRTTAVAHIVAVAGRLDPSNEVTVDGRTLKEHLFELLTTLLESTADHFEVARPIIKALARPEPMVAIAIPSKLNIEPRRNRAYRLLLEEWGKSPVSRWIPTLINDALEAIRYDYEADLGIEALARGLRDSSNLKEHRGLVHQVSAFANRMVDTRLKLWAHVSLIKAVVDAEEGALRERLEAGLEEAWDALDAGWERIETGFRIASRLAASAPELARRYRDEATAAAKSSDFEARVTADSFTFSVRLVIRAYAGLLHAKLPDGDRLAQLEELVGRVPSNVERIALFGELAVFAFYAGDVRLANDIVARQIKAQLPVESSSSRRDALIMAIPALYLVHKNSALELLSELPDAESDEALARTCSAIFMRRPSTEAFDGYASYPGGRGYDDLVDVLDLVSRMHSDAYVAADLDRAIDQIADRRESKLAVSQRAALASRISELIDKKFPNPRFIQHQGYRILQSADLARIDPPKHSEWLALAADARALPNKPDAALVLAGIGVANRKDPVFQSKCFEEAFQLTQSIPIDFERARTLERLASIARREPAFARRCLREATIGAARVEGEEAFALQRRLIDMAHRIDPKLAESVVDALDDDTVRQAAKKNIQDRIRLNELKRDLLDPKVQLKIPTDPMALASAAWKCLGGLNAGSVSPAREVALPRVLLPAVQMPMEYAFPVFAVAIQNIAELAARAPSVARMMERIFDATIVGARVSLRMARASAREAGDVVTPSTSATDRLHLFESGDRGKFRSLLSAWGSQHVREELWICDPYFGPEDLELIKLAVPEPERCSVRILTSAAHQATLAPPVDWIEAYRDVWNRISMQAPPWVEIVVASTGAGRASPSHDRVWLVDGSGLELGTSVKSVGVFQLSSARVISGEEALAWKAKLRGYFARKTRRTAVGELIDYTTKVL